VVLCSQIYLLFWFLFSNILIFLNWFSVLKYLVVLLVLFSNTLRDSRGRDRMVVGFTISTYHHYCEFEPRSWRGILDTTLCYIVCQWLATGRCFSPGTPVCSTNKSDLHDITDILLKVELNTIYQPNKSNILVVLVFLFSNILVVILVFWLLYCHFGTKYFLVLLGFWLLYWYFSFKSFSCLIFILF
jgi:hypothetical protein